MFHHRLLYIYERKGGQEKRLLSRGHTKNTGSWHWTGGYYRNYPRWPGYSKPFSVANQHTAPESSLAARQSCKGKWQASLHLLLTTTMQFVRYNCISSSSPFSDAAILGEWQGHSPSGCCLPSVSSHVTVIAITNVPIKLVLGFYPSWFPTHSLANPEKLQREKVTICQSFSLSCLPQRCSLFTLPGEIIVFTVCTSGLYTFYCAYCTVACKAYRYLKNQSTKQSLQNSAHEKSACSGLEA